MRESVPADSANRGVSMGPGATALIRLPWAAYRDDIQALVHHAARRYGRLDLAFINARSIGKD
jgi:hypothetical protein